MSRAVLKIGTLTSGGVTINENSKTENEFAPNKQSRLESELENCHSENRRQEREKQRYKNDLKETLKGSVVIISLKHGLKLGIVFRIWPHRSECLRKLSKIEDDKNFI